MATYTVDWFTTLDGFGSGPAAFWGKEGPELLAQRDSSLGRADQTLVLGANTYRLMERFASAQDDPGFAAPRQARKIVISRGCDRGGDRAVGSLPILAGMPDIDLELVDSRLFDGRIQQLVYIPTLR